MYSHSIRLSLGHPQVKGVKNLCMFFLPVNLAPWKLTLSEEGLTLLVHAERKNIGKYLKMKKKRVEAYRNVVKFYNF